MTDEQMIEAMARAMCPYVWEKLTDEPGHYDDHDEGRNYWRKKATAANTIAKAHYEQRIEAAVLFEREACARIAGVHAANGTPGFISHGIRNRSSNQGE